MVKVEGGTFWMGADDAWRTRKVRGKLGLKKTEVYLDDSVQNYDNYARGDESPVHSVTLSTFYLGETVVTQALWKAVMGTALLDEDGEDIWDEDSRGDVFPAYCIDWNSCCEFIQKLNSLTGKNFSLPTEAEWEYAARGGNRSNGYIFSGSDDEFDVAWFNLNSENRIHPVGELKPNELGIFDMSGNIYEWCSDGYGYYTSEEQYNPVGQPKDAIGVPDLDHVIRGGDYREMLDRCRVSSRERSRYWSCTGLRLALSCFSQ